MLFNSIEFAIFLTIVFTLYWFLVNKNLKLQNTFLLLVSYFYYGCWDWRFLFLLIILSVSNYFIGIGIDKTEIEKNKKNWLIAGLILNIGILGVFKYFNFFIESFIDLLMLIGYKLPKSTIKIVLPVGISFYVFLSLSYIIDIYKKTLSANKNIIEVLLSLGFFPIILAGPIQRPITLIPQIVKRREFNYNQVVDGLRQILWGLFAKVVIADNLAFYVDDFFLNYSNYSGSTLLLGAAFYTLQIYADFSGYSNIAIGIAKLFGFSLMRNFAYPYFSRDISEFWKRWHISLVTWFRDYVFFPISFAISYRIKNEKVLFIKSNLFIYIIASIVTWFLTGLWHGANYTFILWGMIHGFFLIVYNIQRNPRKRLFKNIGINKENYLIVIVETLITLFIVMITWVIFRANNLKEALLYMNGILSKSLLSIPKFPYEKLALITSVFSFLFLFIEWFGREQQFAIAHLGIKWYRPLRWAMYYFIIAAILYFGGTIQQFIYFQF